jgi:hypothetical protein
MSFPKTKMESWATGSVAKSSDSAIKKLGGQEIMKKLVLASSLATIFLSFQMLSFAQCGDDPIDPALDVPFEEVVETIDHPGVTYLALINGDTPKPNECGLNPSNDPAQWTGWGGPLNHDNMSIGEGGSSRNLITIGEIRYERGIGSHALATFIYDLAGREYKGFHAVVGPDTEKSMPGAADTCGHGGTVQYVFSIDGGEVYRSAILRGFDVLAEGKGELVEFDIPAGAKELQIDILDGGDGNSCDHGDLGDARLMTAGFYAIDPVEKLATTWGSIRIYY